MLDFLVQFLADITVGTWIRDRSDQRRSHRNRRRGRVRCGLRVEAGAHPGLSSRWRRGTAEVSAGRLVFRSHTVSVVAVDDSWSRPLGLRESVFSLNHRSRLVRLTTPTARLEWAVVEQDVGWATAAVRGMASAGAVASARPLGRS